MDEQMEERQYAQYANLSAGEWCGHCEQSGLVMLDEVRDHASPSAAPCPMCEQGWLLELNRWPGGFWGEGKYRNLDATRWNNGLSILMRLVCQHRPSPSSSECRKPTTGHLCVFHRDSANRGGGVGARGREEFGAVLAGFSFSEMPSGPTIDELVAEDVERGRLIRGRREALAAGAADRETVKS